MFYYFFVLQKSRVLEHAAKPITESGTNIPQKYLISGCFTLQLEIKWVWDKLFVSSTDCITFFSPKVGGKVIMTVALQAARADKFDYDLTIIGEVDKILIKHLFHRKWLPVGVQCALFEEFYML